MVATQEARQSWGTRGHGKLQVWCTNAQSTVPPPSRGARCRRKIQFSQLKIAVTAGQCTSLETPGLADMNDRHLNCETFQSFPTETAPPARFWEKRWHARSGAFCQLGVPLGDLGTYSSQRYPWYNELVLHACCTLLPCSRRVTSC